MDCYEVVSLIALVEEVHRGAMVCRRSGNETGFSGVCIHLLNKLCERLVLITTEQS